VKRFEATDDLDEVGTACGGAEDSEAERPLDAHRGGVCPFEHAAELFEHRLQVAQEPIAERRQLDAAAGAVDELGAELLLERAQALADPGGRQLKLFGGAPEVQFLGEGEEQTQLP